MHSYTSTLVHCAFSTKGRRQQLRPEWNDRVWAFMGGIARENGMKALAIGGVADHVHLLLSLPAAMPVAKAVQLIKAGSSKMVRQTFSATFEWQEGYGSFSVGVSQVPRTVAYIQSQAEHHRKWDFRAELEAFCKRHGITLDARD